jgi:hypothetical protein
MTGFQEMLEDLAATPDQFERLLARVRREDLAWRPSTWDGIPGERFPAIGQLCHLRDIEIDGYHVRFRRVLDEERPDLISVDGYALEKQRGYDKTAAAEAMRAFRSAREGTHELLRNRSERELQRRCTFAEYGELSLLGLIHILCSHDQQHLACMHWLLGKVVSRKNPEIMQARR